MEKRRTKRGVQLGAVLGRLGHFNTADLRGIGQSVIDAIGMSEITVGDVAEDICVTVDFPELPDPDWPGWYEDEKKHNEALDAAREAWVKVTDKVEETFDSDVSATLYERKDPFTLSGWVEEIDLGAELMRELADRGFKIVRA